MEVGARMTNGLRVYDVMAFQGAKLMGPVRLEQILFDATAAGMLCTGIQKLAQRFVLEILTAKGSMFYLPNRGTRFMTQFRQGSLHIEADVFIAFNLALNDVELNLAAEELDTDPPDERYASANLDSVTILSGTVALYITLMSQAGTTRAVILPVATTPGMVAPVPDTTTPEILTTTI
jgi:hypothetical protein